MEKSHKQIISILCIVWGIIFVAIGSVVWYWQLKPYWKVRQSVSWQAVRAVVISIKGYDDWAKTRNKHESINYFVDIRYSYSYKNKNYTGDQYSFYKSTTDGKKLYRFVRETPPGTEVICFVNPEKPSESVIIREKRNPLIMLLLGVPCFLVGFYFVFIKSEIFRISKKKEIHDEK